MVPWNRLPPDVQNTLLALIVMSGGSTLTSCCAPMVCDPPPPPSRTAPPSPFVRSSATPGPMICDPLPPPSMTVRPVQSPPICDPPPPPSTTRPRTGTPMICDPLPPPARTRTPTPSTPGMALQRFQLRSLQMTVDATLKGASVRGTVYDRQGQLWADVRVTVQTSGAIVDTRTARNGSFFVRVSEPGACQIWVADDKGSALPLQLKPFDVANTEWVEIAPQTQRSLPLAEIRSVDIVWSDDLTFQVETPWTGARYRWSVTGGLLEGEDEQVAWQPPAEPGRYLLQLVADWGYAGLAVDSIVLTVNANGSIYIS